MGPAPNVVADELRLPLICFEMNFGLIIDMLCSLLIFDGIKNRVMAAAVMPCFRFASIAPNQDADINMSFILRMMNRLLLNVGDVLPKTSMAKVPQSKTKYD
jgi:hypothetical protein